MLIESIGYKKEKNIVKLLTIIVPTFNMEDYLPKCLYSLVIDDETLMNMLEVIVVNDGSTDKSSEIAHGFERKYPQTFCVIDKENGNYGSCINSALKVATGKYIKTIDADDYVDAENFKEFLELLTKTDADAILHYARRVSIDGSPMNLLGISDVFFKKYKAGQENFSFSELVDTNDFCPVMHNTTFRTRILLDMDYKQLEGIFYTDNQWMFLPMTKVKTLVLFPKVVYLYLIGRDGQSVSKPVLLSHFGDELRMRAQLVKEYIAYDGDEIGRKYLKIVFLKYIKAVFLYNIFDEMSYTEKDIRRLDTMLRDMGYSHYEEMNSWKIPNYAYRHSVTVAFWRKWDGRWFYLLEGTLKFFWDPYKKLKKVFKQT